MTEDLATIDLRQAPSLQSPRRAAVLHLPTRGLHLLVVRDARSRFHVVSQRCTHGGQVVSYLARRGVLMCNNFNHSIFTLEGQIVKGPAESPLASYPHQRRGRFLEISLPALPTG
jgi:Rieske Fe-S protein